MDIICVSPVAHFSEGLDGGTPPELMIGAILHLNNRSTADGQLSASPTGLMFFAGNAWHSVA
jgi:hypothetical protein